MSVDGPKFTIVPRFGAFAQAAASAAKSIASRLRSANEAQRLDTSRRMLGTLNRSGKHVYAGTVPAAEVARRRAKNKVARKSRRMNRSR